MSDWNENYFQNIKKFENSNIFPAQLLRCEKSQIDRFKGLKIKQNFSLNLSNKYKKIKLKNGITILCCNIDISYS